MKILFLILAHDNPKHLLELAQTITDAASDARAIIHFDRNASQASFDEIKLGSTHLTKIALVEKRVRCKWGDFSLVEAVLNALKQEINSGRSYDYVLLLSGACLPCRPIRQLERYLAENPGREYIEAADESWMIGGYRAERYQNYFIFPASPKPSRIEHFIVQTQKFLGIRRVPPDHLEVRFGSQWWALTWRTCNRMIDYLSARPDVVSFFKKTYIPDESLFQSLVWKLANRTLITGFGLTYFQFTRMGKPTVFYDDHGTYPFKLNQFFYRKISSQASTLRVQSLLRSRDPDDGEDLSIIGAKNYDYRIKIRTQTISVNPWQIYFGDRIAQTDVLKFSTRPYIFICGSDQAVAKVLAAIQDPELSVIGRIFSKNLIDLGDSLSKIEPELTQSVKLRDYQPLHYLCRVRSKIGTVPVFGWSPGDLFHPMMTIAGDPNVLLVTLPLMANSGLESQVLMDRKVFQKDIEKHRNRSIPGVSTEAFERGIRQAMIDIQGFESTPEFMVSGLDGKHEPNMFSVPVIQNRNQMARATAISSASISNARRRFEPWFSHLISASNCVNSEVDIVREDGSE